MLLLIISFVLFIILLRLIKDAVSRIVFFSFGGIWYLASLLSLFGIDGINIPGDWTLSLISFHLIFFYLGFITLNNKANNNRHTPFTNRTLSESISRITESKVFICLFILVAIYVVQLFARYWSRVLILSSMGDVRSELYSGELFGPHHPDIDSFILTPLSWVLCVVLAYLVKNKRYMYALFIAFYLIVYYSLGGGRFGYFKILLTFIFVSAALLMPHSKGGKSAFSNGFWKKTMLLIIVFYVAIVFTTAGRMGDVGFSRKIFEENVEATSNEMVAYFVGPIAAFDNTITNGVSSIGGYKGGGLTLSSIDMLWYAISHRIGINYKRALEAYTDVRQYQYISIGYGHDRWNALYTWCDYFYCDLGLLGVILFPFFWGGIMRATIVYYYRKPNVYSASILVFFYTLICFSIFMYLFNQLGILFGICVLFFLSSKSRNVTIKNEKNTYSIH